MERGAIAYTLRSFITENYLLGRDFTFADGDSFLEHSIMDSIGILQLVAFLQDTYGIEAYDVFDEGLGRDFYGQVLRTLEKEGGYVRCGPCVKPRDDSRSLDVYSYDFRLDNIRAAQGLHELIERIRSDHGDPRLQVDVLAHSNGGLLARYYSRYGTADLPDDGPPVPTWRGPAGHPPAAAGRHAEPRHHPAGAVARAWRGGGPAQDPAGSHRILQRCAAVDAASGTAVDRRHDGPAARPRPVRPRDLAQAALVALPAT